MPLFGGLFSKKETKQAKHQPRPVWRGDESDWESLSQTSLNHYQPSNSHSQNYDSPRASSSTQVPTRKSTGQRPSQHDLQPPPRPTFGGLGRSTASLPATQRSYSGSNYDNSPTRPSTGPRKAGLFSWAKKSKPAEERPPLPSSFEEPEPPSFIPPARPRLRLDSNESDSSQRISVAAFREAQARSRTGSPVASPTVSARRPPSTLDRGSPSPHLQAKPQPAVPDSSDSSEEESEDDDDEATRNKRIGRKRTITRRDTADRPKAATVHGHSSSPQLPPQSQVQQPEALTVPRGILSSSRSNSPLARTPISAYTQSRGSVSTPTLANGRNVLKRAPSSSSSSSSSDKASSDEDAPLSALVGPKRPGSSMSNHSNASRGSVARTPVKPLVDIKAVIGNDRPRNFVEPPPEIPKPYTRPVAPVGRTAPPSVINNNERNWTQPTSKLAHNRRSMSADLSTVTPTFQKESLPASTSERAAPSDLPKTTSMDRLIKPPIRKSSAQVPTPPERKVPVQVVTPPERQGSSHSIDEDMLLALQYMSPELVPPPKQTASKPAAESSSSSSESESDDPPPIKPTPIQQRAPPPAFAVTSRPAHRNQNSVVSNAESAISSSTILTRRRSVSMAAKHPRASTTSTLISQIPASKALSDHPDPKPPSKSVPPIARPGTLMANQGSSSSSSLATSNNSQPQKPFRNARLRRDSPASSTGDDSSGRLPLTPRDGSEFGDDYGPAKKTYSKERRSVSFDDVQKVGLKQRIDEEDIRKARRREEARASIELGNVVNGRDPRRPDPMDGSDFVNRGMGPGGFPMMPNMNMGFPTTPVMQMPGWPGASPSPGIPMNMMQMQFGGADPTYIAAHQQAMFIAKQTYQMAVAQHAMNAAGDEWERGSAMGGFGGSQVGGSPMQMPQMGMNMGMGGYGFPAMNMGMPGQWPMQMMSTAGSAYGGYAQTDVGGHGHGGGWGGGGGSRSVYGEAFGPSGQSASPRLRPPMPSSARSDYGNGRPESSYRTSEYDGRRPDSRFEKDRTRSSSGAPLLSTPRAGARPRTLTAPSSGPAPSQFSARAGGMKAAPSSWGRHNTP